MDASQQALKLILEGLGIGANIGTVSRRKTVQKSVYLVQAAGIDLGYRYNWYVMGPYSPALTRDYYGLQQALEAEDEPEDAHLKRAVAARVSNVSKILFVPDDVPIPQAEWAELLASIHFLSKLQGRDTAQVRQRLKQEKPHVAPYFDEALRELEEADLM